MAKQLINLGSTANDGSGDTLRQTAEKINDNFTELYDNQSSFISDVVDSDQYVRFGNSWLTLDSAGIVRDVVSDGNLYARSDSAWVEIPSNLEAPTTGLAYGRKSESWVEVVEEADSDGTSYVRNGAAWVPLPNIIDDAPSNGNPYVRQDSAWTQLSTITGVTEAPSNGQIFARSDSDWIDITTAINAATIAEAPSNGKAYVRLNAGWSLGVTEAPSNGNSYVREDATWKTLVFPVNEAPVDSLVYGRSDSAWTTVTEEAPIDSDVYGRVNGAWTAVPSIAPIDSEQYVQLNGDWSILDLSALDAPADADFYVRDSSTYVALDSAVLTQAIGQPFRNGLPASPDSAGRAYGRSQVGWVEVAEEAPTDGSFYARKDKGWEEVSNELISTVELLSPDAGDSDTISGTTDYALVQCPSDGNATIKLPAGVENGNVVAVKRIDTNSGRSLFVEPNTNQRLEGNGSGQITLTPMGNARAVFYDSDWWIFARDSG